MILHDFYCKSCESYFEELTEYNDALQRADDRACPKCQTLCERVILPRNSIHTVHHLERAVVWVSPDGKVAVPPVNTAEMPERYRKQGYRREEATTLRELEKFEKYGIRSEKAWYDDGSGSSRFDGEKGR